MPSKAYTRVVSYRSEFYPNFWNVPVTQHRDEVMADPLKNCDSILEIGAGVRNFKSCIPGFKGIYKTMDSDETTQQDFYSLEAIEGRFDGIILREVVEHIPREAFFVYLEKLYDLLNPGGVLVLSTPNPLSPQFWSDYTHVSPWPMQDMYSLLKSYGFTQVLIQRVIWPSKFLWVKRLYWTIHTRMYNVDFAGAYVAIAHKPSADS